MRRRRRSTTGTDAALFWLAVAAAAAAAAVVVALPASAAEPPAPSSPPTEQQQQQPHQPATDLSAESSKVIPGVSIPLLPPAPRLALLLVLASVVLFFAAGAGVGGGPVLVPLIAIVGGFASPQAVALSTTTIFAASVCNACVNLPRRRHPTLDRPLVSWPLLLLLLPPAVLGAVAGALVGKMAPAAVTYAVLALLMTWLTRQMLRKANRLRRAEGEALMSAAESCVTGGAESGGGGGNGDWVVFSAEEEPARAPWWERWRRPRRREGHAPSPASPPAASAPLPTPQPTPPLPPPTPLERSPSRLVSFIVGEADVRFSASEDDRRRRHQQQQTEAQPSPWVPVPLQGDAEAPLPAPAGDAIASAAAGPSAAAAAAAPPPPPPPPATTTAPAPATAAGQQLARTRSSFSQLPLALRLQLSEDAALAMAAATGAAVGVGSSGGGGGGGGGSLPGPHGGGGGAPASFSGGSSFVLRSSGRIAKELGQLPLAERQAQEAQLRHLAQIQRARSLGHLPPPPSPFLAGAAAPSLQLLPSPMEEEDGEAGQEQVDGEGAAALSSPAPPAGPPEIVSEESASVGGSIINSLPPSPRAAAAAAGATADQHLPQLPPARGDARDELAAMAALDRVQLPGRALLLLAALTAAVLATSLAAALGTTCGSWQYWVAQASVVPPLVAVAWAGRRALLKRTLARRKALGLPERPAARPAAAAAAAAAADHRLPSWARRGASAASSNGLGGLEAKTSPPAPRGKSALVGTGDGLSGGAPLPAQRMPSVSPKLAAQYGVEPSDLRWTPRNTLLLQCVALPVGMLASALGLGGAALLTPLLVSLSFHPLCAAATTQTMLALTTLTGGVLYATLGAVTWPYAGALGAVAVAATLAGQLSIDALLRAVGRASIIVYALCGFFTVAGLLAYGLAGAAIAAVVERPELLHATKGLCSGRSSSGGGKP